MYVSLPNGHNIQLGPLYTVPVGNLHQLENANKGQSGLFMYILVICINAVCVRARVCVCVQAKEVQEELAMDMKILQDLLAATDDDKQKQAMRKKELNEEMQLYCSCLEEQKREEERREKELDAMVQTEVGLIHIRQSEWPIFA